MRFRTRFVLAASSWSALVSAALVAVPSAFRDRLPDPVASHWGPSGAPDGAMSFGGFVTFHVVLWAAIAGVCLSIAVRAGALRRRYARGRIGAALGAGACLALGLQALSLNANLDRARWEQAGTVGWRVVPLIAAALLAGWIGHLAARPGPDERPEGGEPPLALHLDPGQRAVWVSSVSAPWASAMAIVGLVAAGAIALGAVLGLPGALWITAAALVVIGLAGLALSSVRVKVSPEGLRISFGPLRWPSRHVPLEKIEKAWVERRRPSEVGGWGFRGLPGRATIMLRGGECLVVRYTSGGELGISIDDATTGAALLTALKTPAPPPA